MDSKTFKESIIANVASAIERLDYEWIEEFELPDDILIERRKACLNVVSNVFEKILLDEGQTKERIKKRIMHNRADIEILTQKLGKKSDEPPDLGDLGMWRLDAHLQKAKLDLIEEQKKYLEKLDTLIRTNEEVCLYLGEAPYILGQEFPIKEEMKVIKYHTEDMRKEEKERICTYLKLRHDIVAFIETLDGKYGTDELIHEVLDNEHHAKSLSKGYIQDIRKLHSDLDFQVREVEMQCLETKEKISLLWSLLHVSSEDQQQFLCTIPNYRPSSLSKLKTELEKMKIVRSKHLGPVIEELRTELCKIWDKCHVAESTRNGFSPIKSDKVSEELFEAHEKELNIWKSYYEEHSSILDKIEHFLALFDDMLQLELKAKDPARLYNTRGGSLLQEEKERKRVQQELPRIENQLVKMGEMFEKEKGRPFYVGGDPIKQYLSKLWDIHSFQREQEKIIRTKIKTPSHSKTGTPGLSLSSRKRAREGDENLAQVLRSGPKKVAKTCPTGTGRTLFKSPMKTSQYLQVPNFAPLAPLVRRDASSDPKVIAPSSSANPCLQSSMTYDKFKNDLQKICQDEVVHSSMLVESLVDHPLPPSMKSNVKQRIPSTLTPRNDEETARFLRLNGALNLASPCKKLLQSSKRSVIGGSSGGAFLRRSTSQPMFSKCRTPRAKRWLF